MKVSREVAISRIERAVATLNDLVHNLKNPETFDANGAAHLVYKDGVPFGLRVDEVEGVDQEMLRGELLLVAGELEVLAQM